MLKIIYMNKFTLIVNLNNGKTVKEINLTEKSLISYSKNIVIYGVGYWDGDKYYHYPPDKITHLIGVKEE